MMICALTALFVAATPAEALQASIDAGLAALEAQKPADAASAFAEALELSDAPELHLYLAHAYLGLERHADALEEVQKAKALSATQIAQPLIEARARRALGDRAGAYDVLLSASKDFEGEPRPLIELVALAHDAKLDGAARRHTDDLLGLELERDTVLALFHLLYQDRKALPLLERLAARLPADAEVRSHLAHAYASAGHAFAAGRLFEDAVRLGGPFAWEAANQYALAERYGRALRMNAGVDDETRRRRQRIEILFAQRRYGRVVALERGDEDAGGRYRLAYAHYALGQFARATALARSLAETPYADPAASLLKTMGRLVEAP